MENLVFTQLSIPEIRQIFRQELETYFSNKPITATPQEQDELLTIQQAANLLDLSVPTIYSLVSKAETTNIPVSKRGKRLYFSKHELTDWIKAGRKKTITDLTVEVDKFLSNRKKKA